MTDWKTWFNTLGNYSTANDNVTSVFIGNTVTSVPVWAFGGLNNLASVTFEPTSQVATIGDHAFYNTALQAIEIPASVTNIGEVAFGGAPLTGGGFTVTVGNTTYSVSAEGALLETATNTLHTFPSGKTGSYTVESGITKIGDNAFYGTHLTAVTIPAAITDIGTKAFTGSSALKTVIFEGSTPPTGLVANTFESYVNFIIVPTGAGNGYKTALAGMTDVDTKVVEKGPATVNVANETELKEALAKPYLTTINVTADFSIASALPMNADHTLTIPSGNTLTATVNSAISIGTTATGAHTLTLNGGGTFVSAVATGTGHAFSGNAGTLNLENIVVNLQNTSVGGVSVKTVNVGSGATVNLNSATGGTLINIQNGCTLNVNTGGTVDIQNFSGAGIQNIDGVLHIDGGTVSVSEGQGSNWGINNTGDGLLKVTSGGALNCTSGSAINLSQGSKVDGLNGKFKDRGTAFTATGEVTVGAENDAASANGLTGGLYISDGSVFAKETITVTAQPEDTPVTEGSITGSLSVTATASNGSVISYQWQIYNASIWDYENIPAAINSSFTIPTTLAEGTYQYACKLSATGCEDVWTTAATVTVNAAPPAATGTIDVGGQTALDLAADHAGAGWSWTALTAVLTLDASYTGEPIAVNCQTTDNVNLAYTGDVTVSGSAESAVSCNGNLDVTGSGGVLTINSGSSNALHCAIEVPNGSLTIGGSANVNAEAACSGTSPAATVIYGKWGVTVSGSANVTTVATGTDASGIFTEMGDLTISTTGIVTANGKGAGSALSIGNSPTKLNITSGAVAITGNPMNSYTFTAPVITGGTVTIDGVQVYLATITLPGISASTTVTAVSAPASGYGIQRMVTDASGVLYFWLPEGSQTVTLTTAADTYYGTADVLANHNTTATLTAGAPPSPTYAVTIGVISNGSVSPDKTLSAEGETVTLTVTPDAGYEPDAVTAHKTGDADVTVETQCIASLPPIQYTFIMPAYPVTVEATFRLTDAASVAADKAALTWDAIRNANTLQTAVTTDLSLPATGANGATVAWSSDNTAVIATDGAVARPSYAAGDATLILTATVAKGEISDNTTTFTLTVTAMPDADAPTVAATAPANGATNVAVTTATVSVTFDEPMNTGAAGTLNLVPTGVTLVNPQWSNGDRTVTYDVSGFEYGTTYTFGVSGFTDVSGNTMTAVTTGYSFTVIENPANPDNADITAAKTAVESATYSAEQTNVATSAQAKSAVETVIAGLNLNGVTPTVLSGTFTEALSGTVTDTDGTNGLYTFTVTLDKGAGVQQTTAPLTLAITATPYDATPDNADITAAKTIVESATYSAAQTNVATSAQAKSAVETVIAGLNLNGVTPTVIDETFTEALSGTVTDTDGTNGSYTFTVTLDKGAGAQQTTAPLTLAITATPYDATPDNADITAA
jgi:hypothetical protein